MGSAASTMAPCAGWLVALGRAKTTMAARVLATFPLCRTGIQNAKRAAGWANSLIMRDTSGGSAARSSASFKANLQGTSLAHTA
eukprot:4646377-Prymnesium_polylepis.4